MPRTILCSFRIQPPEQDVGGLDYCFGVFCPVKGLIVWQGSERAQGLGDVSGGVEFGTDLISSELREHRLGITREDEVTGD